ncbi:MAG: tetratricopeptide repeat protein, partial [Akkermansiaceae bacterium]|nr:tetratricopeptide repeat protein [Akkermansiaceae bacterium]
ETQLKALSTGEGENAARASLWLARVYTRPAEKDYATAAEVLGRAVESFGASSVINDLRFDFANALMARPEPDWKNSLSALQQIQVDGTFSQLAEVLSQRAVCLQKLGDYETSLAANGEFLARHGEHPLASEARFMRAENLFLLGRLQESREAFEEFLTTEENHPRRDSATFRVAQIHHAGGLWEECLATAVPLFTSNPDGPLYAQLPFIVGDSLFRQEKWSEAVGPLQDFLATRVTTDTAQGLTVKAGPNVDLAITQLAVACDRTDQKEKALTHFRTITDHYPVPTSQLPLALSELGRLAYESGDRELARKALERFVASDTAENEIFAKHAPVQRPRVRYYLGWLDAEEGRHEAAAARFGEVIALDASHSLAPDAALQQG